ncbi:MAG: hypothetical protein AAGA30_20010, partial [Planctomycetota bacterium]
RSRPTRLRYGSIRTNLHIADCSVKNCKTGIDLHAVLNCHVQDTVCSFNRVGMKIRQSVKAGSGNANLFSNVEVYNNEVGVLFSGQGSKFPMASNTFTAGTVQNNKICGVAAFDTSNLIFIGTHFERNTESGKPSLTVNNKNDSIDSSKQITRIVKNDETVVVPRSNLYLNHSDFCGVSTRFTTPDKTNMLMEKSSTIRLHDSSGYGATVGTWCNDLDGSCKLFFSGVLDASGVCLAEFHSLPDEFIFNTRFSFVSKPKLIVDTQTENLAPRPNKPLFESIADVEKCNSAVFDEKLGEVNSCQFQKSIGSTKNNKVAINVGCGKFAVGERLVTSFLARLGEGEKSKIRFELTNGTYAYIGPTLDDQWTKITLLANSSQDYSPLLYIYPMDEAGATLHIAKMMTYKSLDKSSHFTISDIAKHGKFNPKTQGIELIGASDVNLDCNNKKLLMVEAPLTENRQVILPKYAFDGDCFEFVRNDSSQFKLTIGSENGTIVKLAANEFCKVSYSSSTGKWHLINRGGHLGNAD